MEDGAFWIRTDLAEETRARIDRESGPIRGVRYHKEKSGQDMSISTVVIETGNAAKRLHRPKGRYITIEDARMTEEDDGCHREVSVELARQIRRLLPGEKAPEDMERALDVSVLVVGLGNRKVTPDALGPAVAEHLCINRHILREFGRYAYGKEARGRISALVPGVMAQTGMECVEIIRGVAGQTSPDVILTIDALAARSMKRLGRTVQLTDTGITPGSGIGNHRNAIDRESVGVPVISLGVPTVVDAATIVSDAMMDFAEHMRGNRTDELERYKTEDALRNMLSPQLYSMFVTPKDIDETIRQLSYLISESINIAFLGNKEEEKGIGY